MHVRFCAGFSDACMMVQPRTRREVSEKRQGRKSREVGRGGCSELYGNLAGAVMLVEEVRAG
jgi:hypothetical protein